MSLISQQIDTSHSKILACLLECIENDRGWEQKSGKTNEKK